MSSGSRSGKSARISSSVIPEAKLRRRVAGRAGRWYAGDTCSPPDTPVMGLGRGYFLGVWVALDLMESSRR